MRKRPQSWLTALAAILALLAIGLRDTAAAIHHHAPAPVHHHESEHSHDHEDGRHEQGHDCPLCALVLTGSLPPPAPERIPAPAPTASAPPAAPERQPNLFPATSALPRGPPRLPAVPLSFI